MRGCVALSRGLLIAAIVASGTARAAPFTVTNNADSGPGSLRQAILDANASVGADNIAFDPGLAGATIALASPLPNPTEPTDINADLGGDCDPDVNVSGAAAGSNAYGLTLGPAASSSRVRGLTWHSWARAAVRVFPGTTSVVIECNHFGTDLGGTAVLPNGTASGAGVGENGQIELSGNTHRIGPDNLIVSGRGPGVRITESFTNGAYPDFTALLSDATPRVYAQIDFADSCGSFSGGGFTPVDGNGLPFTENFGMRLRGRITVGASGNYSFDFADLDDNATLRIDGGVIGSMQGPSPPIQVVNLSSGAHTIEIDFLEGLGAAGLFTAISGPGSIALSSDDQALCATGQVGLCAELFQLRVPSHNSRITRNRMRDNGGPGIRLGFDGCGLLANDAGDVDVGPNTLLNSPTITAIDDLGGGDFSVSGTAAGSSTVELFLAAPDPNGFGEGMSFLGSATASAGGNFVVVAPLPSQGLLTATAADASGNTSQFGRNFSYTTGALGLYANGLSTSSIELSWIDQDLGETGYRLERSTNGTVFNTVITLGAEAASHTDTGLSANTLYYYRVIATNAGGDLPASNRATASTFPNSAAKVCYQRVPRASGFVSSSASEWDGTGWGVVWVERDLALDNTDVRFRRFDALLAPQGPVVAISDADSNVAGIPFLLWNGTHYGVIWAESVRGAAGSHSDPPWFFTRLDANGQKVGGSVRIPLPLGLGNQFAMSQPQWDGTHWGLFFLRTDDDPLGPAVDNDVWFLRLNADGTAAGAPVAVTATPNLEEFDVSAAWSPQRGHYGLSYKRGGDLDWEWVFQRVSATGAAIDVNPAQLDTGTFVVGQAGSAGLQSLIWDGANWALGYAKDDPTSDVETAVWLRRIDGATGQPIGVGPSRLSDDAPDASLMLRLLPKPGGGYAAFTRSLGSNFQFEVARMQADANGLRIGTRSFMTPDDGHPTLTPSVNGNGTEFLILHTGNTNASLPAELYAVRVAADASSPPTLPVAITSGHDPNGSSVPTPIAAATLGAGFAALWAEGAPALPQLHLRVWDGAGQVVASPSPLSVTQVRNIAADMVGVGNSVAVAWKTPTNNVMFARYNATGGPITGEKTIATAVGGQPNLLLRWNGEHYGLFYSAAGGSRYQRVDEAGNAVGSSITLPRGLDNTADAEWVGDRWALVTRAGAPNGMDYLHLAADGTVLADPVSLVVPVAPFRRANRQQLHFNGRELALSYGDWRGLDPPFEDIFFALLNRDGSYALPPFVAVGTQFGDVSSSLYSIGTDFRLVPNVYGHSSGLAEFVITPAGGVSATPRYLSNRNIAVNRLTFAHNGATLGTFYFPGGQQHLYFHTDACLVDATPPPCPALTAVQAGATVQVSWTAVSDPESTVIRYVLYRDGLPLAETDADVLSYTDGFDASAPNVYQVRALNGAFVESASCPTAALSLLIFRDGFEGP